MKLYEKAGKSINIIKKNNIVWDRSIPKLKRLNCNLKTVLLAISFQYQPCDMNFCDAGIIEQIHQ